MSPQDSSFTLDPAELLQRKADNARRVHALQIPLIRLLGFVILSVMGLLHPLDGRSPAGLALPLLVAANLGYALLSWAVLWRWYGRSGRLDLSSLFMHLDVLMWLLTLQRLEQTHLFFGYLLLVRVGDHIGYGFRSAFYFSNVVVAVYLGYTALLTVLDPGGARWQERLVIAAVMYMIGGYLAFTGFVTERLRNRTRAAVRTARQLVDSLETKTGELEAQAQELRLARRLAEQASVAKSRFLAMMSHEIRTPMNGVLGATELLLGTPLKSDQRAFAETARQSGQVLLSILDNVLDLSRIEAGRLDVVAEPVHLRSLLGESLAVVQPAALAKGIALDVRIAADVPPHVVADALRLRQVLLNLLANAVKFTERGAVTVSVGRMREAAADGRLMLRFEVADTGIGIPEYQISHLFEPFMQADSSTTRQHGGSGLGLAIVRQLTRLMGGEVQVRSEPGRGTCFSVTAPVGEAAAPAPGPRPDAPAEVPVVPPSHVLLAEDNLVNQLVLQEMLSRLGCSVDVVADGDAAFDAVSRRRYDVVFMDCHMPMTDGFEATRRIRAGEPAGGSRLPIIALTAATMPEDEAACRSAGMDDFVSKPVTMAQLAGTLSRWLPGAG
ncbi:ATP-binding protein [Aquincola sp. MAHUQ-54]|uniref:Sensory/regulatory protein RpfC n=1 Tax=Aquincola agrisoli TaxID=3119538 RepID=A0AAW9QGX3_9BURK